MNTIQLGRSDLRVTPICLGTMTFGEQVDEPTSHAILSRSLERGVNFARQVRAGMTHINDVPVNDEANAPFGGEKNSGLGRFNGDWAIDEFTRDQWISLQHRPRQYPF